MSSTQIPLLDVILVRTHVRRRLQTSWGQGLNLGLYSIAFVALLSALTPRPASAGPIVVDEASLGPSGKPHQANLAPDGHLLVSDDVAGQIWRIDPGTGDYVVFEGQSYVEMSSPVDAQGDGAGNLWFADWTNGTLGRIVPGTASLTLWDLPGAVAPWGVALDSGMRVWVADTGGPTLYRFAPGSGANGHFSCYILPQGGISPYVLAEDSSLWLGDIQNGRILKVPLDGSGNPGQAQWWQPGAGNASPEGLAVDASGKLWWADTGLNSILRLTPDTDQVSGFAPPVAGTNPLVIAVAADRIWFTAGSTAGALDPAAAGGTPIQTTTGTADLIESPVCGSVTGRTGALVSPPPTGSLTWATGIWSSAAEGNGWSIYELPAGGDTYGVAIVGGRPWIVDRGRRKLSVPGAVLSRSIFLSLVTRQ
jgi:streptogramin lyase